jgi:ribosomal protein L31
MVMTLGGSQEKYVVDIWSGNHPFIQGAFNTIVVDEGQVNRFKKRFAGLEKFNFKNISSKEISQ